MRELLLAYASRLGDLSDPRLAGAGLCAACAHARVVESARGSTFVLCGLAATDARFPKYPRLPVLQCVGYSPKQT